MPTVCDAAAYVLQKCGTLTTMKLQRLVFYCQAWSLAWDDKPLFAEDFEAWSNGAVCPELFERHKGMFEISDGYFGTADSSLFSADQIETMDAVIRDLSDKSPQWLGDLVRSERPWLEARDGYRPGEVCTKIIEKETMRDYYSGLTAD